MEAADILTRSPKASAALARRCLDTLMDEQLNLPPGNRAPLADKIDQALPALPAHIQEQIDAIRNIGNFGAHLSRAVTGEIIDVDPGEAEWTLDILDELFDHYYVQPARIQQKRAAVNAKLAASGKKPLRP